MPSFISSSRSNFEKARTKPPGPTRERAAAPPAGAPPAAGPPRGLLQKALAFGPEGPPIHPIVRIGRHAAEGIVESSAELDADLIVFGWGGKTPPQQGSS